MLDVFRKVEENMNIWKRIGRYTQVTKGISRGE